MEAPLETVCYSRDSLESPIEILVEAVLILVIVTTKCIITSVMIMIMITIPPPIIIIIITICCIRISRVYLCGGAPAFD